MSPYGSFGAGARNTYGTIHPSQVFGEDTPRVAGSGDSVKELEREPLITKQIAGEEGTTIEVILLSKSTLPQTVFNEVNVLIGIGLLSLPLGLKYSGW